MKLIHVLATMVALLLCTSCTQPQYLPPALTTQRTVVSTTLPVTLTWQTRLDQIVARGPIVVGSHVLLFTPDYSLSTAPPAETAAAAAWLPFSTPVTSGAMIIFILFLDYFDLARVYG